MPHRGADFRHSPSCAGSRRAVGRCGFQAHRSLHHRLGVASPFPSRLGSLQPASHATAFITSSTSARPSLDSIIESHQRRDGPGQSCKAGASRSMLFVENGACADCGRSTCAPPAPITPAWRLPVRSGCDVMPGRGVSICRGRRKSCRHRHRSMLAELSWSRAATAGIFSVSMLVYAVVASGVGVASDRWGPRRVPGGRGAQQAMSDGHYCDRGPPAFAPVSRCTPVPSRALRSASSVAKTAASRRTAGA
jgi:hypothetical protein